MANARGLSGGNRETREAEMLFHSLFILLIVVNNTLSTRIYIFLCDYLAVIWKKNSTKWNSYEDNSGLVNSFVLCYRKKIFMKCKSLEWKKYWCWGPAKSHPHVRGLFPSKLKNRTFCKDCSPKNLSICTDIACVIHE